jgi:O-antigen/teichoic acid export membrane protein
VLFNLLQPAGASLYCGFAKIKASPHVLGQTFLQAFSRMFFLMVPLWIGLVELSEPLIHVLLGSEWASIVPIVPIVASMFAAMVIIDLCNSVLTVGERLKVVVGVNTLAVAIFILAIMAMADQLTLRQFAEARMLTVIIALTILLAWVCRWLGFALHQLLASIWRSLAAGLAVFFILELVIRNESYVDANAAVQLALGVVVLAGMYLLSHLALRKLTWGVAYESDFMMTTLYPLLRNALNKLLGRVNLGVKR